MCPARVRLDTDASQLTARSHEVGSISEVQELFVTRGWTDGLPITPPTPELVNRLVAAAGLAPGHEVVAVPQLSRHLTVEMLAINAAMAGCGPRHFPVVIAALRAMGREEFNLHTVTVSGAATPLLVIGGPAVRALDVNAGFSVFGSGHVANATIGRAIRLVQQNLCGGESGVEDKATMGHPGKYAYCIGESADDNPWDPLHVDRGAIADSGVTVFAGEAPLMARNDWASDPEPILSTIADVMRVGHFTGGPTLVVLGPLHAQAAARAGWSRRDVCRFLHEHTRRSMADLQRAGRMPGPTAPENEDRFLNVSSRPEDILITVAGGHLYGYSAIVPHWVGGPESMPVAEPLPSPMPLRPHESRR